MVYNIKQTYNNISYLYNLEKKVILSYTYWLKVVLIIAGFYTSSYRLTERWSWEEPSPSLHHLIGLFISQMRKQRPRKVM